MFAHPLHVTLCAGLALAAVETGACSETSRPLQAPPVMMTPAPAPAAAPANLAGSRSMDPAAMEREVERRLNARLDLSGPWTSLREEVSLLAPEDVVAKDGGVDVLVHFHGAPAADEEWRATGVDAAVVSVSLTGYGVAQYRGRFGTRDRFLGMVDDAVHQVGGSHVRRLGLVSWSAGYGAVADVLADSDLYAMVDALVVLDGLHADYREGLLDEGSVAAFERFAEDAAAGSKLFVVTHSSVMPGGYASTTETAAMLLAYVGVPREEERRANARGMIEWYHADKGSFHVRGFRGDTLRDHLDQVHLVGDAVRAFIAPRWTARAVSEETSVTIEM